MSRGSSSQSEQVYVLHAERSRLLVAWWLALHGVLGASLLMLRWGGGFDALMIALLLAHAGRRWPDGRALLLLSSNGEWALPARGRFELRAGPGTALTAWWVRLVLIDAAGRSSVVLLLKDQLGSEAWRKIQVALRECDND